MNAVAKLCVICFDEMSLKAHVQQSNTDELVGFEDYGDNSKTNYVANSATVFMACGLLDNWKQPLSYYLVNESCGSETVEERLVEVIDKVETPGQILKHYCI